MERVVKLRTITQTAFTRTLNDIQEDINTSELDRKKIQALFSMLERKDEELIDLDHKILDMKLDAGSEDLDKETKMMDEYLQKFLEIQVGVQVESEEGLSLAMTGVGLKNDDFKSKKWQNHLLKEQIPTAAGLLCTSCTKERSCVFCNGPHQRNACWLSKMFVNGVDLMKIELARKRVGIMDMVHTLVLGVCLAGLVTTTPYISQESDESTEVGVRSTTLSAVLETEVNRSFRDSSTSSEDGKDSSSFPEDNDSTSSEYKNSSSSEDKNSSSSEDKDSSSSEYKDSSAIICYSGDLATLVPATSEQSDGHSSRIRRDTSSKGSAPRKILPTIREEPPSRVARAEPNQEPGADKQYQGLQLSLIQTVQDPGNTKVSSHPLFTLYKIQAAPRSLVVIYSHCTRSRQHQGLQFILYSHCTRSRQHQGLQSSFIHTVQDPDNTKISSPPLFTLYKIQATPRQHQGLQSSFIHTVQDPDNTKISSPPLFTLYKIQTTPRSPVILYSHCTRSRQHQGLQSSFINTVQDPGNIKVSSRHLFTLYKIQATPTSPVILYSHCTRSRGISDTMDLQLQQRPAAPWITDRHQLVWEDSHPQAQALSSRPAASPRPDHSPAVISGPETRKQQASSQSSLKTPPIYPVGRFARGVQESRTPQGPTPAQKPLSDSRSPGLSRQGPTDIGPGAQQFRPDSKKMIDRPKVPHF
uniref:Uncharacterized protein n=2 Tax=Timema TaxID=61471 RepID=A0A7R9NVY9_9NEOP|nr:unnamed protein product [Timema tahoe]